MIPRKQRPRTFGNALRAIAGEDAVLDQPEDMLAYEFDASIDRAMPQAMVFPTTTDQVVRIVRLALAHGVPIIPRGAGTGLSGGAIAVHGGVVIGTARMDSVLEVDLEDQVAIVQPGMVNLDLSRAVAKHGLHFVPDPSSQKTCTIGGNIAENSGGPHCLAYGVTANHVLGMEVVLPDAQVVWLGGKHQDLPGYDLPGLFIGAEGTTGIATKIAVKLARVSEATGTLVAVFPELEDATDCVSSIIAGGMVPAALEIIDRIAIEAVRPTMREPFPENAGAVLLVEVEGPQEAVAEDMRSVRDACAQFGARELREATTQERRDELWAARKTAFGALGRLAPNYYILDGVVPRTRVTEVLRGVGEVSRRYGFTIMNVFHAGDGNLHPCITFDERRPGQTRRVLEAGAEIMRLCVDAGGSITGEHGVGLEKSVFLPMLFSDADQEAMHKLRDAFGPSQVFNPGKVFPSGAGCGEGWRLPRLPDLNGEMFF